MSPVANELRTIPSTQVANSIGFPVRPKGVLFTMPSRYLGVIPAPIGVSNTPGAIAMTLILYLPRSLAIGSVMPMIAPFEAEQTTCPFCPSNPATLVTLMMTPLSPFNSSCSDITLAAYLDTLRVPITLILSTFSMVSEETTPLEVMVVPAANTPAQLTTTWIFLQFSTVNLMSSCTFVSSATLVLKNRHPSLAAICFPCSSFRSAITTWAPWLRNSSTVARPNPEAPPVMMATRDLSIFICTYVISKLANWALQIRQMNIVKIRPYQL